MGRVAVDAGRVVRRYDRRLDNATRSTVGPSCYISALSGGLDLDRRRAVRGIGVRHQFYRRSLLLGYHHGSSGKKKEKENSTRSRSFPIDVSYDESVSFTAGIHIGNLDAKHSRLFVGDVEGPGSRRCPLVIHSWYISELAAKRATGRRRAVDALSGDPLYTRDTVVSRAQRQRRRGGAQFAVAARGTCRHTTRAAGDSESR